MAILPFRLAWTAYPTSSTWASLPTGHQISLTLSRGEALVLGTGQGFKFPKGTA